ncbi:MAG: dihydrolipoyllysine-residue succinyltransferase component of 2-oxoglutarate dehydrogenase complex [Phycisphaerae bacterium]|jgi:2-oxoglutarate dehydrogenase E2 component (dihydrolipoamide succinyltransferase)|nr:MAG: dihydrolipoyllysine-residue succinyltransferase component of 2-oxoglutarate dehydrogenase complex [Phycisphaerae bacterium]
MSTTVTVPNLGDSVTQATLLRWHKQPGEKVALDEPLCELETDKANADVTATAAGVFTPAPGIEPGTVVQVGQALGTIDPNAQPSVIPSSPVSPTSTTTTNQTATPRSETTSASTEDLSPAVRRLIEEHHLDPSKITPTGPGGRLTKEDVVKYLESNSAPTTSKVQASDVEMSAAAVAKQIVPQAKEESQGVTRTPMSKIRKRIADNLLRAQETAAILTTFNEVDLSRVMELRTKHKERFEKLHGVGLGFMSFFAKACTTALKEFPRVNGQIDGDDIITFDYVNLGIAVSTDRGLAVPVLRHADKMSFAKIESEIKRLAQAVRDGKLGLQELSGGTFTITNGGVFGSLLSTPILNPPQSAILGMHTIQKRAVVVDDQIVIRPMMYIALSYDHRLIDGKESVSFLVRVKELLEDPSRLLLEV